MTTELPCWRKSKSARSIFLAFAFLMFFFFFFANFFTSSAFAAGLMVDNMVVVDRNTTAKTAVFEFSQFWWHAWKDETNNDAAWFFFKFSTDGGTTWKHATLKTAGTNPSGSSGNTPDASYPASLFNAMDVIVPADKKGMFLQAAHNGRGEVHFKGTRVVWDYGADLVTDAQVIDDTSLLVRVFGIEMVYIPSGGFYIGEAADGTGATASFEFGGVTASLPGVIQNEEALTFSSTAAESFYYNTDATGNDVANGTVFQLPESFPKGYKAFYMMKYEISEAQWMLFFNMLNSNQKTTRDITSATAGGKNSDAVANRNTIAWTSGDSTTNRPDRAMAYLHWMDLAAFLDWAALRPMTELEYEKAAHGPLYPVVGQYAWGTTVISGCVAAGHSGTNDSTEICTAGACAGIGTCYLTYNNISFTTGDATYDRQRGPTRNGMYATYDTYARHQAGAGYYGNMDLTGNVQEMVVCTGSTVGRGYMGTHGDGILTDVASGYGNASNLDWPGMGANTTLGVTGAAGSGVKGGGWAETVAARLAVADRNQVCSAPATRTSSHGGRGVRTAP